MNNLITNSPELAERWINAALLAKRQGSLMKFCHVAVVPEFGTKIAQELYDMVSSMDSIIYSIELEK